MREVGSNLRGKSTHGPGTSPNISRAVRPTYTGGVDDIVEGELGDKGVKLEEEREGLADTT